MLAWHLQPLGILLSLSIVNGWSPPWDPLPNEQKEEACLLSALSPVSWTMSNTLNFLILATFCSELKFPEGLSGCASHCVSCLGLC